MAHLLYSIVLETGTLHNIQETAHSAPKKKKKKEEEEERKQLKELDLNGGIFVPQY